MTERKVTALVTGANRGIGFEVSRQLGHLGLRIILSGRDSDAVADSARKLATEGISTRSEVLDVSSPRSVQDCARRLQDDGEQIAVLVNNAAIYPDGDILSAPEETFHEALEINFFGALRCARAFLPGMTKAGYGRIVNISSGNGSFSEGLGGPAAYSISKAALNALTVRLAREVSGNIKVNAVCPGWVRTRMGGPKAPRDVKEGADTIVWLATLPEDGPNGDFFRDRQRINW